MRRECPVHGPATQAGVTFAVVDEKNPESITCCMRCLIEWLRQSPVCELVDVEEGGENVEAIV